MAAMKAKNKVKPTIKRSLKSTSLKAIKNSAADSKTSTDQKIDLKNLKFNTTKDIPISKLMVDQVIGQEDAVNVIKKAANQRRHVLLIGEPGTGKSMLGMALAELLPKEKLVDVLALPNPNDENQPFIRTIEAGKGREVVAKAKFENSGALKTQNIIILILAVLAMVAPWWIRNYYKSDIMFAAFFLGGMIFLAAFIMFINLGKKVGGSNEGIPKLIVDNFDKKHVAFYDATGAHAGALLGDVLHDPFQTFFSTQQLQQVTANGININQISGHVNAAMTKHNKDVLKKVDRNYEAVHLPKDELIILGEQDGQVTPVDVLSVNRYDYDGEIIKIITSENKEIITTPEHKIAIQKTRGTEYVEARNVKKGDEVLSQAEDIIIDEADIIRTFTEEQQALAKSYYEYTDLKKANPSWGYKRIATLMHVSNGRTRWWSDHDSAPYPVQTVNWLKDKGLLPLRADNPNIFLIAKVLGATFGDGGIFDNLNGIFLSSKELDSVKEFGSDIEKIFGLDSNENSRIIEGGEYGHSWCYQNTNRNIIRFFLAVGAPKGNKTKIEIHTPKWVLLDKLLEREFFGSFLGGELGVPTIHKRGKYLTCLEVGITGYPAQRSNRINFLNEVSRFLNKNGIQADSIYEGKTTTKNNTIFRLIIGKKMDNLLSLINNIKINYCPYKVLRLNDTLEKFTKIKHERYKTLTSQGFGAEGAMKVLHLSPRALYFILNKEHSADLEVIA